MPHTHMIGRTQERALLADHLQRLVQGEAHQAVVITGQAGIGKSQLVLDLQRRAKALGVNMLQGAGDAIEKNTAYLAWRLIFQHYFGLDEADGPETNRTRVLDRLEGLLPPADRLATVIPLLNDVLPVEIDDSPLTAQMDGGGRAANLNELLIYLLEQMAAASPLLLVIEDAHWLDSASWGLLNYVFENVAPLLLILVTRPLNASLHAGFRQIVDSPYTVSITLDALSSDEVLALVCQRLGVVSLPDAVSKLIIQKAEGHPFFSEEMAYALRDSGVIQIEDRQCKLSPTTGDISALYLPGTIHDVITSRMDRLTGSQLLTLKVASVIGRVFTVRILQDVLPSEFDSASIHSFLKNLTRMQIADVDTNDPELAYVFKHVITQEVAYNLLQFSQRQQLHHTVAEWYEQEFKHDLAAHYPLLAYHYSRTDNTAKTIDYLEKAGEDALHKFANQEAAQFFTTLLENHALPSTGNSNLRLASWERQLGQAYLGLSQMAKSEHHLNQALKHLGHPRPETDLGLIWTAVKQMVLQIYHRVRPPYPPTDPDIQDTYQEAARAMIQLNEIFYLSNDLPKIFHGTLAMVNLAEKAGTPSELAHAYATITQAIGLVGIRWLAELYEKLAWETARDQDRMPDLAYVSMVTGMYNAGIGSWQTASVYLEEAVDLYTTLGNEQRLVESMGILATSKANEGHYARSRMYFDEIVARSGISNNTLHRAWGLDGQAEDLMRQGAFKSASDILNESRILLTRHQDVSEEIRVYGLLASLHTQMEEYHTALGCANACAARLEQWPTLFSTMVGYSGIVETYLGIWEAGQGNPGLLASLAIELPSTLYKLTRQALKSIQTFSQIFPIGEPRALLHNGTFAWLSGQKKKAFRLWNKSLESAVALRMPFEIGSAHLQIGRHLGQDNPARLAHLREAQRIFKEIGAAYEGVRTARHIRETNVLK